MGASDGRVCSYANRLGAAARAMPEQNELTNAQGCKREESGGAIEGRDKERCKLTRLARLAATEEATTSDGTACVRRADRR